MKKLHGKSVNALALPPHKGPSLHVLNVRFQIDGLPVMVLDLEMLGKRAGGMHSRFHADRVEAKLNGKPIIAQAFTKRGRKP